MQQNDARFLELLRRWQSGDFNRADERELNALVATDDFRREAMEGFMSAPETAHKERLAHLHRRLRERAGRSAGGRVIALPQVLAAAAALAVLLVAIMFFPKWNTSGKGETIAQTKAENERLASEPDAPPVLEAPISEDIAAALPSAKPAPSISGPSERAHRDRAAAHSDAGAVADAAAAKETQELSEEALQPSHTAAPPPVTNMPATRSESVNKANPSLGNDSPSGGAAPGRVVDTPKLKKSEAPVPAARADDETWHETDKKPNMDAEKKAAATQLPRESEPAGGWEAFREYLRQNARLTAEARNNNVSGTVLVEFSINANGEPQGFVVRRSLGYGCDQEAVRLIKNWEWVRGERPTVQVEIPFVR
ncbi:MAG: TonB family protein [Saprospiraceae bacterium]|nr:TonB family protein [Saprospiraceae bacterium]